MTLGAMAGFADCSSPPPIEPASRAITLLHIPPLPGFYGATTDGPYPISRRSRRHFCHSTSGNRRWPRRMRQSGED